MRFDEYTFRTVLSLLCVPLWIIVGGWGIAGSRSAVGLGGMGYIAATVTIVLLLSTMGFGLAISQVLSERVTGPQRGWAMAGLLLNGVPSVLLLSGALRGVV